MSTIYIVKDGIIIDKLEGSIFYRDARGKTVMPLTQRAERELIQISENNKKIQELTEQLCASKENRDGALLGQLADQAGSIQNEQEAFDSEKARRELARRQLQADVLGSIEDLRTQAAKLEQLMFCLNTSQGEESVNAEVDLRTGGGLDRLTARLETISEKVETDADADESVLSRTLDRLKQIGQEISALPDQAKKIFAAQVGRQEQAELVAERLRSAAFQIVKVSEGDGMFDPLYIAVENETGDKAVLTFSIEGDVTIDSKFSDAGRRRAFQQLVLGTLVEGGATGASGHCVDGDDPADAAAGRQHGASPKQAAEVSQKAAQQASGQMKVREN